MSRSRSKPYDKTLSAYLAAKKAVQLLTEAVINEIETDLVRKCRKLNDLFAGYAGPDCSYEVIVDDHPFTTRRLITLKNIDGSRVTIFLPDSIGRPYNARDPENEVMVVFMFPGASDDIPTSYNITLRCENGEEHKAYFIEFPLSRFDKAGQIKAKKFYKHIPKVTIDYFLDEVRKTITEYFQEGETTTTGMDFSLMRMAVLAPEDED